MKRTVVAIALALVFLTSANANAQITLSLTNDVSEPTWRDVGYEVYRINEFGGREYAISCQPDFDYLGLGPCADSSGNVTITYQAVWDSFTQTYYLMPLPAGNYIVRVMQIKTRGNGQGNLGYNEIGAMLGEDGFANNGRPKQFYYNGLTRNFGSLILPDPKIRIYNSPNANQGYFEVFPESGGEFKSTFRRMVNGTDDARDLKIHTIIFGFSKNGNYTTTTVAAQKLMLAARSTQDVTTNPVNIPQWLPTSTLMCVQVTVMDRVRGLQYGMFQRCAYKMGRSAPPTDLPPSPNLPQTVDEQ